MSNHRSSVYIHIQNYIWCFFHQTTPLTLFDHLSTIYLDMATDYKHLHDRFLRLSLMDWFVHFNHEYQMCVHWTCMVGVLANSPPCYSSLLRFISKLIMWVKEKWETTALTTTMCGWGFTSLLFRLIKLSEDTLCSVLVSLKTLNSSSWFMWSIKKTVIMRIQSYCSV